jgi:hypothetical protein
MYCYEQLVSAKCTSWYKWYWKFGTIYTKWYWKFGMIYTKSTVLCERTYKIVKKILHITFSAVQTEIKKICYSGIRYGLTHLRPSEANLYRTMNFCCLCVHIPLFGWLFHSCLPNLIKFQVPHISMSLCVKKLRLNYFQGLGNTLLAQQRE